MLIALYAAPCFAQTDLERAIAFLEYRDLEAGRIHQNFSGTLAEPVISRSDDSVREGLFQIVESEEYMKFWKEAFHSIGIWGSLEPRVVDAERLYNAIEKIEQLEFAEEKVLILEKAYVAASRFGWELSRDFFKERVYGLNWNGDMPVDYWSRSGKPPVKITAQSGAIKHMDALGETTVLEYLNELIKDPIISADPILERAINTAKYLHKSNASRHRENKAFYEAYMKMKNGAANETEAGEELNVRESTDLVVNYAEKAVQKGAISGNSQLDSDTSDKSNWNWLLWFGLAGIASIALIWMKK